MASKTQKTSSKNKTDKNNDEILSTNFELEIETTELNECLEDGSFIEINIDKIEENLENL